MIQSYMGRNEPVAFPIALASLAPHLQDRYELNGFDPNVYPNPEEELRLRLKFFAPDIIAVSLRNIDTTNIFDPHIYYEGFLATIKSIREFNRDIPLIVGGAAAGSYAGTVRQIGGHLLSDTRSFRALLGTLQAQRPAGMERRRPVAEMDR